MWLDLKYGIKGKSSALNESLMIIKFFPRSNFGRVEEFQGQVMQSDELNIAVGT